MTEVIGHHHQMKGQVGWIALEMNGIVITVIWREIDREREREWQEENERISATFKLKRSDTDSPVVTGQALKTEALERNSVGNKNFSTIVKHVSNDNDNINGEGNKTIDSPNYK